MLGYFTTSKNKSISASQISSKLRYLVLNYRRVMDRICICLPAKLWTNRVKINRISTRFTTFVSKRQVNIPDDLLRDLIWPFHIPLPSLETERVTISSLVKPLPDCFPDYPYDPRHMRCLSRFEDVLRSKLWSWWEVQRRLPPCERTRPTRLLVRCRLQDTTVCRPATSTM
jgi:hypothetical protein